MSREVMKQALEALDSDNPDMQLRAAIALRQALVNADDTSEKHVDEMVKTEHDRAVELGKAYERGWNAALAQQEPVAWLKTWSDGSVSVLKTKSHAFADHELEPLYTAPPKREWVGLTDDEADELVARFARYELLRRVEAKLKEKNI